MHKEPLFLAMESSCDDTSLALFRGKNVLSMKTHTQLVEHQETRGVVPESAARLHAENIFPLLDELFFGLPYTLSDLDFIACTYEPGLTPSLLVTKSVAKVLSQRLSIPLVPINHIEGHIFALLLGRDMEEVQFPVMVLTVSGGHNEIYLWENLDNLSRVAHTRDDSAGEAFDKVAKMLGLPFPGGAHIARYAQEFYQAHGERVSCIDFPIPKFHQSQGLGEFSFSGLKSAVKRHIDERIAQSGGISEYDRGLISYSFQKVVSIYLSGALYDLASYYREVTTLGLCGGVSANDYLKDMIRHEKRSLNYNTLLVPSKREYSLDNAAMIGMRAYYLTRGK